MDNDELTIRMDMTTGGDATVGIPMSDEDMDRTLRIDKPTTASAASPLAVGQTENFVLRGQTYVCRKA